MQKDSNLNAAVHMGLFENVSAVLEHFSEEIAHCRINSPFNDIYIVGYRSAKTDRK